MPSLFVCLFVKGTRPRGRNSALSRCLASAFLRAYATYWSLRSLWTGSCDVPPGTTSTTALQGGVKRYTGGGQG